MIVNKYNKKCQSCNVMVEAGKGFAFNDGRVWRTTCASAACHARLNLKSPAQNSIARKLTSAGEVIMPYDREAIPLLRAMPGAKWNPQTRSWFVDVSSKNINRTLELANKLCLEIDSSLNANADTADSVEAKSRADKEGLYSFQRIGVEFLSLKDKALLADDMGCGKTIQALVSIPNNARVIVVCPAAVKYNWQDESLKWRPEFIPTVVSGKNGFVIPKPGQMVIVNYDILPAYLTKDGDIPADVRQALSETILICDEAHVLKNYKTARSQKITNLSKVCQKTWFLTGTPLMNRPFDLFGVLSAGGMEREVFGSFNKFLALFGAYKDKFGAYHFNNPSIEVPERLRRVMLRRMKTEVLPDLPPKTYQKILTDLNGELASKLDALYEQNEDFLSNKELPPFERFSAIRAELAMSRVSAAHEIVESYEDQETPLILFSVHKEPVKIFGSREGWACITGDTPPAVRTDIVSDFQAGKLKGLALTIGAGGVGLTLTRAATALFLDLDWTPALNLQAEDRIARIGQTSNKVHIIHLVSRHVLDQHVYMLIKNKMDLIHDAIENDVVYKPKPLTYGSPLVMSETEDELVERMKKVQEELDKKQAKDKVGELLKKGGREFKLDDKRRDLIKGAMSYMVSSCDGALARDAHGFNKPDARIAHWIFAAGLNDDDSLRLAESILFKYRKTQLGGYDDIWV